LIPALNSFLRPCLRPSRSLAGGLVVLLAIAAAPVRPARPEPAARAPADSSRPVEVLRAVPGPIRATPPWVQVEAVAESTWVLRAGTANVVAALTAEGWVLVDTGTRAEAIALRGELQRLAARPIVAVFNTHFHDDHAGGNAVYRGMGVPVYASGGARDLETSIRERMAAGAPREVARLDSAAAAVAPGPEHDRTVAFYEFLARWWREGADDAARDPRFVVPADSVFDRRLSLRVGGLPVEARAFARAAHSDGDAVVAFPTRGVVAAGDVVVRGAAPWADQFMGGGSIEGVLEAQTALLDWVGGRFGAAAAPADSAWRIVPGHGAVVGTAELAADRDALRALRACARQGFEAGRPRELAARDCAGVGFPGESAAYAVWLFDAEWRNANADRRPARLTKP
jgi:cyclase